MDAVLNHFYHTLFWPMVLIFGGAWAVLRVLRWLAFRLLPVWLVGPNGLFFDTSGNRLGMFDRTWRRPGWQDDPWQRGGGGHHGSGGSGGGDSACD